MASRIEIDTKSLKAVIAEFERLEVAIPKGALKRAGHRIGKELKDLLLKPTASWDHKPKISHLVRTSSNGVITLVKINDAPYVYVSLGTAAHRITPVRASRLAFPSGYRAKTSVGSLEASGGGSFGSTVYSLGVFHPGIQARNFHLLALEEIKRDGIKIIAEELKKELGKMRGVG